MTGLDVIISIVIGLGTGIATGYFTGISVAKHYVKVDKKEEYKSNLNNLRKQIMNMKNILYSKDDEMAKPFFTLSAYRMNLSEAITYCGVNKLDATIFWKIHYKFAQIEENFKKHGGLVGDIGEIYDLSLVLLITDISYIIDNIDIPKKKSKLFAKIINKTENQSI